MESLAEGDEEKTPDECVLMLDSVLEVEGGAASESESGNIVLRSAVDEKEEAANLGASA